MGRGGAWGPVLCAAAALALVGLCLSEHPVGLPQVPAKAGPGQAEESEDLRTCEEIYNGTNCWQRLGWAPGLVNPMDPRIFAEPQGFYRLHDDILMLAEAIFSDDSYKDPYSQLVGSGKKSYCYFPVLYYACASAFQQCREDGNLTAFYRVNAPPPPLGTSEVPEAVLILEQQRWEEKSTLLARVPIYPCLDFCADPELQECKGVLVDAIQETLGDNPAIEEFLEPLEEWFNCDLLNEKSRGYSYHNDSYFCLGRPRAPSPPPSPPPPPLQPVYSPPPPASSAPPGLGGGLAAALLLAAAVHALALATG